MPEITADALRPLLVETFRKSEIPSAIEDMKMGDLEDWDSLGNFNLLLSVEETFDVRFSMDDMAALKSVRAIVDAVKAL